MPLLCISLLALLLLPLSLSGCITNPEKVRSSYSVIVKTHLDNTRGNIRELLNTSCPELKQKLRNCTANHTTVVSTLHFLTCKMKNLGLSHTEKLAKAVLRSINCPCPQKPTKKPNSKASTVTRRRRNEHKSKETKQLCKAKAILSAVTECYEMLSSRFTDT
ncbi:unnamed protein product [Pleuronectes platessa]|uniref:Interleukin-7 n=1 Tax=Pleuronectes platessa TaxID=8262 RepID=A0A9N7Z6G3_PLEPL|nr:unnamed protein product [Pleuronectes platessa]